MTKNEIKKELITARDEYIKLIKAEILGPGSEFSIPDAEHELISSSPISRYSIGILYPQGIQMNHDNDETIDENDESEESISERSVVDENPDKARESERKIKHVYEIDDTANENLDEEISLSSQYMQSSMGITFLASGDVSSVNVKVTFATYRNARLPDCAIPYLPDDPDNYVVPHELSNKMEYDNSKRVMRLKSKITKKEAHSIFDRDTIPENEFLALKQITYRFVDYCTNGHVRVPHSLDDIVINFLNSDYVDDELNRGLDGTTAKITALRKKINNDVWSITIMLVNDAQNSAITANNCIFQPCIQVDTENNRFKFIQNHLNTDYKQMDYEEQSLELLYRNKKVFGTGLGTSVDWKIDDIGDGRIWSDFLPQKEIAPMSFSLPENDIITLSELSMKYLSDLNTVEKKEKLNSLKKLVDLYKQWTDGLETEMKSLDKRFHVVAQKNIDACKSAYNRMYSGIKTLENNDNAYSAFLLANRAMFMQRVHLIMQANTASVDRYPDDEEISDILVDMDYYKENGVNICWRPFQIAFLLMDINSIVNDSSEERDLVDLIWFPTGGGKTEAYLGLTAFTIFYRRLTHIEKSDGTAVIMRYTLRLLAAQQFTRAATLICACEYIRQDCEKEKKYPIYPLGKKPITIGLWIGSAHIPNNNTGNNSAKYHLDELLKASAYSITNAKERHNKFQVLKCPWCGTKMVKDNKDKRLIGSWGYSMRNGKHFYMYCPQQECAFTNKLPIQIIDEELYDSPPTLLFGTVDKFAMLPWDSRIGSFFGIGLNNRSPELIIQDELHLISGALGTIVGLYETCIDALCSNKGTKPKIIASTATIRRATEQCSVLYNRDVVQFPAPGLDADDSFFARADKINYSKGIYGRKYIGIMPSGKTKAMMEIRLISALLQKVYTMDLPDEIKDKLWTLTAYFNSLKDLGKTATLVEDDVKDFIVRTANRMFTNRRLIVGIDELTSRVSTTELNETLDKLEKTEYTSNSKETKKYASNILLATNMISVGIDVARLNVMIMVGQPKLTSEYIQASSRVGREYPGSVFVQYDATKSRDRSHYERFKAYHESFYRFVEPTGATPFSKPARDRALHAVIVSLLRQFGGFSEDSSAKEFNRNYFSELIKKIEDYVIRRINGINNRAEYQVNDDIQNIREEMEGFFNMWQEIVDECNQGNEEISLYFGKRFMLKSPGENERRLLKEYSSKGHDIAKETLTSMRNVDASVSGSVVIWED